MKLMHVGCGGEIVNRKCQRCKRKWNPVSYLLTPNEIRMIPDTTKQPTKEFKPSQWTAQGFASHLPKWPKWARILTVVVILVAVAAAVVLLRR